jgi:two-component system response regulator PhoP
VVEDEPVLRESLRLQLAEIGFGVDVAVDGEQGLSAGLTNEPDAAIVDLGLPKLDGLDVIRRWRAKERRFPIVILTARQQWRDKVDGLVAGADDFVCKPVVFQEIAARISAVMRRVNGWASSALQCGPFTLNLHTHSLTVNDEPVELTSYEYRLVEHLMLHAGKPFSTLELAQQLYEAGQECESNVVTQLIFRIRRKLDPFDRLKPIETLRGGGYRFAVPRRREP